MPGQLFWGLYTACTLLYALHITRSRLPWMCANFRLFRGDAVSRISAQRSAGQQKEAAPIRARRHSRFWRAKECPSVRRGIVETKPTRE